MESVKKENMCTFVIDDQLVEEAERSLNGLSLQIWLQQQVEALVRRNREQEGPLQSKRIAKVRRRAEHTPTDAELQTRFANCEMPSMPEDSAWKAIIDANIGKTIKPVEKWL